MRKNGPARQWGALASWDEVCRRASGRRRYNAWRRDMAVLRKWQVVALVDRFGLRHGVRVKIARLLGVSGATITRDLAAILRDHSVCPTCNVIQARPRPTLDPVTLEPVQ